MFEGLWVLAGGVPLGAAYGVLALAHAVDVLTTALVLLLGGREANPVARWAMALAAKRGHAQTLGLVWLKALATAPLLWFDAGSSVVLLVAAMTAAVALWNVCVAATLMRSDPAKGRS